MDRFTIYSIGDVDVDLLLRRSCGKLSDLVGTSI